MNFDLRYVHGFHRTLSYSRVLYTSLFSSHQDPQGPDPWVGTLEADKYANVCPQSSLSNRDAITGSEDCLYLNIFSPQVRKLNTIQQMLRYCKHGIEYLGK
jgi:hypothetical protein